MPSMCCNEYGIKSAMLEKMQCGWGRYKTLEIIINSQKIIKSLPYRVYNFQSQKYFSLKNSFDF